SYVARTLDGWPASRPSLSRWYAYDLTPAYGLLLDSALPDWRPGLTKESDITERLAQAVGWVAPPTLKGAAKKAATRYGYSQIESEEKAREADIQRVLQAL